MGRWGYRVAIGAGHRSSGVAAATYAEDPGGGWGGGTTKDGAEVFLSAG